MHSIHHQVGIRTDSAAVVYDALTSLQGIAGWWTRHTDGEPDKTGRELGLTFGGVRMQLAVEELVPGTRVAWRCVRANAQWEQTLISFDLSHDRGTSQVIVDFTHTGWKEATPLAALCSTKWAIFLLSLKQLVEEGKGSPYPDDMHINYFE